MSIKEYKDKIIGLVKEMENEHGMDVISIEMTTSQSHYTQMEVHFEKFYDVKITTS